MERAWPMALLFLAFVALSQGQKTTPAPETEVAVERGARLVVECALRPEQRAVWRKDGAAPPPDMRADETRRDGALRARLSAARAAQHHAGLYECAPDSPRLRVRLTGTEPAAPTTAAAVAATAAPESAERLGGLLLLYHHKEFSLYCNDLASSDPTATIVWSINGTALENNKPELRARVLVETVDAVERGRLRVKAANFDDWGNYSCSVGGQERTWQLHAKLSARLPADTSVVEGQKLKLACKVIGYPATGVVWSYSNQSDNISLSLPVAEVFAERVSLRPNEFGVRDAELSINVTQRSDAGWFFCAPDNSELSSVSRLRVKDMYAALWPFLGICAEVFVLCAIILVYEKRRTKPELDDSDTDNHDQKKS